MGIPVPLLWLITDAFPLLTLTAFELSHQGSMPWNDALMIFSFDEYSGQQIQLGVGSILAWNVLVMFLSGHMSNTMGISIIAPFVLRLITLRTCILGARVLLTILKWYISAHYWHLFYGDFHKDVAFWWSIFSLCAHHESGQPPNELHWYQFVLWDTHCSLSFYIWHGSLQEQGIIYLCSWRAHVMSRNCLVEDLFIWIHATW